MKILYADDDSDDREFFAQILLEIDPEIKLVEAADGIETLSLLEDYIPDFIFLDINMPKLNGNDTLIEIRRNPKLNNTKVVMYSTCISKDAIEHYQALNANFLSKPHNVIDGVSSIRTLIRVRLAPTNINLA